MSRLLHVLWRLLVKFKFVKLANGVAYFQAAKEYDFIPPNLRPLGLVRSKRSSFLVGLLNPFPIGFIYDGAKTQTLDALPDVLDKVPYDYWYENHQ